LDDAHAAASLGRIEPGGVKGRALHRFRVPGPALASRRAELRGSELRHLRDVLRLGSGDRVELFDGAGRSFVAVIRSVGPSRADLDLIEPVRVERESALVLTLAVALSKGSKLDWVIEKATELGVSRIVPFTSERTIPERGSSPARASRWRRIASAATAQSGRTCCPELSPLSDFAEVLTQAAGHDRAVLFWEAGNRPLVAGSGGRVQSALLVTGPEGGFSEPEASRAEQAGLTIASLGQRILRAETAAIAAVSVAQFLWGDLGDTPATVA
jgi:16S rRNA (uracil1498-N3)-methyltransferase